MKEPSEEEERPPRWLKSLLRNVCTGKVLNTRANTGNSQQTAHQRHQPLPLKAAKHRDWAYSHLDDGRILRDQRWLLEVAKGNDLAKAKFFDCGDSRDGAGYKDVSASADPEARAARARFDAILAAMPEPKPNRAAAKDNADDLKKIRRYIEQRAAKRPGEAWKAFHAARHLLPP